MQQVKEYKKSKDFEKDVKRMTRCGWRVVSQSTFQNKRSLFSLFRSRPKIIVTYEKNAYERK